jgi:UDP-N-acetylglucosamine 2-epimerase (non-hydrolysing)
VRLGLEAASYVLVTLHRAENVDDPARLGQFMAALSRVAEDQACPLVVSVHPRTAVRLREFSLAPDSSRVMLLDPLGFLDFIKLERHARIVLSDSGTVQEECAILRIPNVTLRDVTERPETIECGSNILSGAATEDVLRAVKIALTGPTGWTPPAEYLSRNVSGTVARIVLGYVSLRQHRS